MQKTRSWQESFDRLEAARRAEQRLLDADEWRIRDAETAYAKAAALELVKPVGKPAAPALLLVSAQPDHCEDLVKPRQRAKPAAKPKRAKAGPRKRTSAKRTAAKAKARASKPRAAKPRISAQPTPGATPPAPVLPNALPASPAEELLITPLPRSASLTRYRKPGLFSLIGSWLRTGTRHAVSGLKVSTRRLDVQAELRASRDEAARLESENQRLLSQVEALLALQTNAEHDQV